MFWDKNSYLCFVNKDLTKYNKYINITKANIVIDNEFRSASTISRLSLLNNSRDIAIKVFIESENKSSKQLIKRLIKRLTRRNIKNIHNTIIVLNDKFKSYNKQVQKSLHEQ